MTPAQDQQLAALFLDYGNKKAAYDTAVSNLNAILGMAPSPSVSAQKIAAMQARDAAKVAMDNALAAYNTLRDDFERQDQAAFVAANPQVAVQIAQTQAQAQVDAAIGIAQAQATGTVGAREAEAKAAADAAKAEEDAKTKKTIIIVAVVVTVVVIGVIVYKKFFSKNS